MQNDWIKNVIDELSRRGYTGKLELNFFNGGISNVNKSESIKAPSEFPYEITIVRFSS